MAVKKPKTKRFFKFKEVQVGIVEIVASEVVLAEQIHDLAPVPEETPHLAFVVGFNIRHEGCSEKGCAFRYHYDDIIEPRGINFYGDKCHGVIPLKKQIGCITDLIQPLFLSMGLRVQVAPLLILKR